MLAVVATRTSDGDNCNMNEPLYYINESVCLYIETGSIGGYLLVFYCESNSDGLAR